MAPLTFEALIIHNVVVDTFEKVQNRSIHHISLAKKADLFILVPASANVIAKVAHGIADDMLTMTFCRLQARKVVVSMSSAMTCATLAITFALAGTRMNTSAFEASEM